MLILLLLLTGAVRLYVIYAAPHAKLDLVPSTWLLSVSPEDYVEPLLSHFPTMALFVMAAVGLHRRDPTVDWLPFWLGAGGVAALSFEVDGRLWSGGSGLPWGFLASMPLAAAGLWHVRRTPDRTPSAFLVATPILVVLSSPAVVGYFLVLPLFDQLFIALVAAAVIAHVPGRRARLSILVALIAWLAASVGLTPNYFMFDVPDPLLLAMMTLAVIASGVLVYRRRACRHWVRPARASRLSLVVLTVLTASCYILWPKMGYGGTLFAVCVHPDGSSDVYTDQPRWPVSAHRLGLELTNSLRIRLHDGAMSEREWVDVDETSQCNGRPLALTLRPRERGIPIVGSYGDRAVTARDSELTVDGLTIELPGEPSYGDWTPGAAQWPRYSPIVRRHDDGCRLYIVDLETGALRDTAPIHSETEVRACRSDRCYLADRLQLFTVDGSRPDPVGGPRTRLRAKNFSAYSSAIDVAGDSLWCIVEDTVTELDANSLEVRASYFGPTPFQTSGYRAAP